MIAVTNGTMRITNKTVNMVFSVVISVLMQCSQCSYNSVPRVTLLNPSYTSYKPTHKLVLELCIFVTVVKDLLPFY